MSCRSVRDWLHRDVESLDEAQRLRFDDHLATCETCRGDRMRMRVLHDVGTSLPVPPADAREYTRAIARALMEGASRREATPRAPRMWMVAVAGAAAIVIAVLVAVRVMRDPVVEQRADNVVPAPAPAPAPIPPPSRSVEPNDNDLVVDEGFLRTSDGDVTVGAALPVEIPLTAASATRLRIAGSRVVIAASSQIRWQPATRTLLLDRGSLEIAAAPSSPLHVRAASFVVAIDDAEATIEPTRVRVLRGTALITDHDGKVAQVTTTWAPSIDTVVTHTTSSAELLRRARGQFAAKQYPDAERTIAAALSRSLARRDEIAARVLLADIAQGAGNLDLATTRYTEVATKFADAPAGESALYAAARIELRRSRTVEATALLSRYLARYPEGRFASDVRRQLAAIH
ncbi:MAG: hypothetical protein ACKV2T_00560 [Kofleriaceae bacterium]